MLIELQRLPKPCHPLFARSLFKMFQFVLRDRPRKDQTILGARRRNIQQTHAFEFFAPTRALSQRSEQRAPRDAAAAVRHRDGETLMAVEHVRTRVALRLSAMQIGNDHDRKFEAFRLMNRHQPNDVSRLIQLTLAFAAANFLELFDVMNKVTYQLARLFEAFGESKKFPNVRHALRAVEVRGDYGHEICRGDSETQ